MATSFLKRTTFTTCFTPEFKTLELWNILIDIKRSEFQLRATETLRIFAFQFELIKTI